MTIEQQFEDRSQFFRKVESFAHRKMHSHLDSSKGACSTIKWDDGVEKGVQGGAEFVEQRGVRVVVSFGREKRRDAKHMFSHVSFVCVQRLSCA